MMLAFLESMKTQKKNSVAKHYFDDGRVEVEVTEEKGEF